MEIEKMKFDRDPSIQLEADRFHLLSEWYHFTLLETLKLRSFSTRETELLARILQISEDDVKVALKRLLRTGLIRKAEGIFEPNQASVFTSDGVPSPALRNFHRQMLEKSEKSLESQSISERIFSSSTLPVRMSAVPRARKLMAKFRDKMTQPLSSENEGEEVYAFNMQFFRLTECAAEGLKDDRKEVKENRSTKNV